MEDSKITLQNTITETACFKYMWEAFAFDGQNEAAKDFSGENWVTLVPNSIERNDNLT